MRAAAYRLVLSDCMMEIQNHEWPSLLRADDSKRDVAILELRRFLLGGVRKGLSGRPKADDAFVEDVVQVSLVRILDRLDTFAGRSAFTTWALSIALRVAFSELRRKHWNNVSLDELKDSGVVWWDEPDDSQSPLHDAAFNALVALVHRLIRTQLTARQRDVMLAELSAMPQDEIARQLGATRNAVYKLSHDARRALRRALETSGYQVDEVRDVLETSMG